MGRLLCYYGTRFKSYAKQGGGGGVLGLLQQIIADAKVMEAEAMQAEKDAQAAYTQMTSQPNKFIPDSPKIHVFTLTD